jgi:hypothetical protein
METLFQGAPPAAPARLTGDELIPDVVRTWPSTRPVFDRHGLHCCGGPYGPVETIRYFSRAHEVGLEKLLGELEEAMAGGSGASPEPLAPDPAGTIYRRFFLAGIAVTLTAGAVWGAWLLLRLGLERSFGAISPHHVNAHGHAQVFGWVGLFVMGFAYQALPRFKQSRLRRPRLALATFPVYLAGLVLRTAGEALHPHAAGLPAGIAGAVLEIVAILVFAWIVAETLLAPTARRASSDRYILAATFWFVAQAVYDLFLFTLTATAVSTEDLVQRIATFQPSLRAMQIHGFAALMILGVSQRYLPGMIGLPRVPGRLADGLLVVLNAAVAGEVAGHIGRRLAPGAVFPWLLEGSVIAFTAAAATLTWKLGILHRRAEPDRSVKFLRAAYAWLLVSLLLLVAYPVHLRALGLDFSHAWLGAARHGITVGFVSLMIAGVAAKVVPTLNGVPAARLPSLWAPFLLINIGCATRVTFQVLTDVTTVAFPVAGVSGLLEVAGLALWGIHLVRVMTGRYRSAAGPETTAGPPGEALPGHIVGWLTAAAPETIAVFERMGFPAITNRLLRETVARTVTIRQACALKGIDEARLIAALNEVLEPRAARRPAATPVEFVGRLTSGAT